MSRQSPKDNNIKKAEFRLAQLICLFCILVSLILTVLLIRTKLESSQYRTVDSQISCTDYSDMLTRIGQLEDELSETRSELEKANKKIEKYNLILKIENADKKQAE